MTTFDRLFISVCSMFVGFCMGLAAAAGWPYEDPIIGPLVQRSERRPFKPRVPGSNPGGSSFMGLTQGEVREVIIPKRGFDSRRLQQYQICP